MTVLHRSCGLQQQQQHCCQPQAMRPLQTPSLGTHRGNLQCWQQRHTRRSFSASTHTQAHPSLSSHCNSSSSSGSRSWPIQRSAPFSALAAARTPQHTVPGQAAAAAAAPAAAALGGAGAVAGGLLDSAAVSAAAAASFKLLFLCGVVAWLSHR
jgi:hypothetical protein